MDIFWRIVIAVVLIFFVVVFYDRFGDQIRVMFFGQAETYTIYVNQNAFLVSIADTPREREQGLSGVKELDRYHGKLFIFDQVGKHGIWMKEMLFPIDILWFGEDFTLVHIESNVSPDTYPVVFSPHVGAKYVLEVNAYTARDLGLQNGQKLTLPAALMPKDRVLDFTR